MTGRSLLPWLQVYIPAPQQEVILWKGAMRAILRRPTAGTARFYKLRTVPQERAMRAILC